MSTITAARDFKGECIIGFPDDYVIIDIETTGFSPKNNEIIEIAAIKVCEDKAISVFQSLIKPRLAINYFISNLTGITNEMFADADSIERVLKSFISFAGDNTLIGHNVNFDINFLYDHCERHLGYYLKNNFIDTMHLFKKTRIKVDNYKLMTICEKCAIQNNSAHRALSDCEATNSLYQYLKSQTGPLNHVGEVDFLSIVPERDPTHPLFKKKCLCHGSSYVSMEQINAILKKIGAIPRQNYTETVDYLILTERQVQKYHRDQSLYSYVERSKIISEYDFYEMCHLPIKKNNY